KSEVARNVRLQQRAELGDAGNLAAVEDATHVRLLNCTFDVDAEVVGRKLQARDPILGRQHESHRRGVALLRIEVAVAFEAPVAGVTPRSGDRRTESECATGLDLLPVVQLAEVRSTRIP